MTAASAGGRRTRSGVQTDTSLWRPDRGKEGGRKGGVPPAGFWVSPGGDAAGGVLGLCRP